MTAPTMLSVPQTAERSGVSKWSIRKMCEENKIVHVKLGSKYLINWEKFVEHLETGDKNEETA